MRKNNKPKYTLIASIEPFMGASINPVELKLYDRYDFIPVVTIIEPTEKDEFSIKKNEENQEIDLGIDFLENLRNYFVPEILITKKKTKIPLKVIKGHGVSGFVDDDGIIEFSCSNKNVIIEDKKVKYGDKIEIVIEHQLNIGEKFSIEIKGKDNKDDLFKSSEKAVTSGKLNITISEFIQDIPSIILLNFDCTENCNYSSEVGDNPVLIWEKGNRYDCINDGLNLFSKTKEGQKALGLFMKNSSKLYSYASSSEGKYSNEHTLMFVENDYTGNFGHTAYKFKKRFPEYTNIDVSDLCYEWYISKYQNIFKKA